MSGNLAGESHEGQPCGGPVGATRDTRNSVRMPFRPALRPGAPLLRRDATHLQVGTSPGIVIPDRPGLMGLLRLLDGSRDVPRLELLARDRLPELDVPIAAVVDELRSMGVVFDATAWSAADRRGLDAEARHAAMGGRSPDDLARRPGFRLAVDHDPASAQLATVAIGILSQSGIAQFDAAEPQLLVVVTCGEPPRSLFERSTLLGTDHLPVVIDEDRVRIGPLVRPRRTPCLECHDRHRADWDPAWPALLHQIGRQAAMSPPAVDAVTMHAAALEVSVEVLAVVDGRRPRSTGACLVVGPQHDDRAAWPVAFHHACVCDLLSAA